MGVTASTSLARLKENPALQRFVGATAIGEGDEFWAELLSFSYSPPKTAAESRLLEETTDPLAESLVRHNPSSGNLRTLVRLCLDQAAALRDESKCESNLATLRVHNALLMLRISLKYMVQHLSEDDLILQLDGSTTVPQISASLTATPQSGSHATPTSATQLGTRNGVSENRSGGNETECSQAALNQITSPLIDVNAATKELSRVEENITGVHGGEGVVGGEGGCEGVSSVGMHSINPTELLSMENLLSRQLVQGLTSLLAEVPLLPFTYDVHLEAINLFLVLLSSQLYSSLPTPTLLQQYVVAVPTELSNLLVHCLLQLFIAPPPIPPDHFRNQSSGIISSITSGLWSLVMPSTTRSRATSSELSSPLRDQSLILLLLLSHQRVHSHNPFRSALFGFGDEREAKAESSFRVSLEKLYLTLCQQLTSEQTTLFLYLLLQGNSHVASFIFSRSDIDQLVVPLLRQLYNAGYHSSHHVYMLLIIVLILSQDVCFNKSIHEVTLAKVPWYEERSVANISLGSLMVMVLVRTIQTNMAHVRDKYLHTNCLAALANMSAHFHSLHLDAAQKLVNLFKQLARKHLRIQARARASVSAENEIEPPPTGELPTPTSPGMPDYSMDQSILEEILLMVLEIINSSLSHNLHNNPHLVYSLMYQREIFEPFRTHPSLMDLVQNVEMVVTFFSSKLQASGPGPYSSALVLETITQASKTWPRNRLRVFSELKFRYVEEDQPEEFFVPYVWTLVFKNSILYWDSSRIHFSAS